VVFYVASQLVDEGVASIEDSDIGARVGLRWALGPFELMNRIGVREAHTMVAELCKRYCEISMPKLLARQAEANRPFEFELVRCRVEDGLAEITLNRPDAMNALNEALVAQLARAFDEVDARSDVQTIVLRGAGKAFVAGADIRFFVKNIEAGDFARIQKFTQAGQELFRRIDESKKHVIVRLDGLSLGGGSELALCADTIVATDKGSLGFPETGIGIYPGLGGTQRTQRRCGAALTRYLVLSGATVDAEAAQSMGLVDHVVAADRIDQRVLELHRSGKRGGGQLDLDPELSALQDFFETADLEQLLRGEVHSSDDMIRAAAGKIRHKAPLACRLADQMIRTGEQQGQNAGLALELAKLESIFRSSDALEGLRSLGRKKPQFTGS
jgi:enoyl-CoA hydratase/3-hydroxyacyl-CoA dehydrogenase